jgi:hypothetical protein
MLYKRVSSIHMEESEVNSVNGSSVMRILVHIVTNSAQHLTQKSALNIKFSYCAYFFVYTDCEVSRINFLKND